MKTYKRFLPYVHWLFLLILLGGCTTVESMRPQGPVFFEDGFHFSRPQQEVFKVAEEVLKELSLDVRASDPNHRYIIAERIPGWLGWGWGEVVGIYLVSGGPSDTRVLVVNRKRVSTDAVSKDWTRDIYLRLSLKLR